MKRATKKTSRRKPSSKQNQPDEPKIERSGGADIDAEEVNIGGDVVGRDKLSAGDDIVQVSGSGNIVAGDDVIQTEHYVERQTIVNLPRAVQIGIGVAVLAIIVIAIAVIGSSSADDTTRFNTEFIFDASESMADPERLGIAQAVFGDSTTYASRNENIALRTFGGGCSIPNEPLVPLRTNQADRLVAAVNALQPNGHGALVESIKAAIDDLPVGENSRNSIVLVSAGRDSCLIEEEKKDPCVVMSVVAQNLERIGVKFTLHIVALRPDTETRAQLTCLTRANVNGYFYEAHSVSDFDSILKRIDAGEGVFNGSFESGDDSGWDSTNPIEIITSSDANAPDLGQFAAQLEPGNSLQQTIAVPQIDQPKLAVWYRTPNSNAHGALNIYLDNALAYHDDEPASQVDKRVASSAPEWSVAVADLQVYAGQSVAVRIEYAPAAAGGRLRFERPSQSGDVLWIDNVESTDDARLNIITRINKIEPTHTPTSTTTATATHTPSLTPSATITSLTVTPTATRTPARVITSSTPTHTASPSRVAAPLGFSWGLGDKRQINDSEWAQVMFVNIGGGAPPYTLLLDSVAQPGTTLEVRSRLCRPRFGVLTVQSADGQTVNQDYALGEPICPTPTSTHTPIPTLTPSNTPLPPPPAAPNPISPPNNDNIGIGSCINVAFSWSAVASDVTYNVEVQTSDGAPYASQNGIGGTSTVFNICNGNYRWRVQAVRVATGQAGAWSNWVNFLNVIG